jgi:hypothetical protein
MGFVGKNDGDIKLLLPNQQQWRWGGGLCCPLRERNAVICLAERDERCSFSELA